MIDCPHCNPNFTFNPINLLSCPLRLNEPTSTTVKMSRTRQKEFMKAQQNTATTTTAMLMNCHHNIILNSNMSKTKLVKRDRNINQINYKKTTLFKSPTATNYQSNRRSKIRHATIQILPQKSLLMSHYLMLVYYLSLVVLSIISYVESVPAYIADQGQPIATFVNPSYPNPLSAYPSVTPTTSSCPLATVCQCKWSNNKLSASCDKRNLATIPSQLPPDTQVLDMNGNSLNQLAPHIFQDKHLNNLQKIYLSDCKISFIADDAFSHLTNLIDLDLSNNHLQSIPVKSFEQLNHSLRKLSLAYNQIQVIEADSFISISHLTNLDLSNNQISQLKQNAFSGLSQLKELKLNDNRLTQLPINIVEVFPDYLLLDLFTNPWHCDCELRQSIDYLTRHHVQQSIQPSCATPQRHKDIRWPNVRSDEFLCPPVVLNRQNELIVGAGSNVSLACTARGSPPLTFVWFQDEKNMTSSKPNNLTDGGPSSTKLLEERRYEIAEELGPPNQPNITTSVLYLYNLELSDTSMFFCWVENGAGYTMANYSLVVNDSPPASIHGGSSQSGIFVTILGEAQMGLLSIAFVILLTIAIIFLLMFKHSSRSSKSSQSSDLKHSKGHQHNMPQIETISSSNKFSSISNQRCGESMTDSDDEEGEEDDDNDTDDTDRSSSGSNSSCRKNPKVIAASDLDGFIEHMRSGIINMDYHSMSPVIQFNNSLKDNQQQQQQQRQQQQSQQQQQQLQQQSMISQHQQHLEHQQQQLHYLDPANQVNPHHLHHHHHHFQSSSNASSIPYYGQNNINGSTSMATTTSDLSPASSSGSNNNFVQPAPITNCDLQQHHLADPSMVAPATNTTTTSYTSDYQSGYSEDPSMASNQMMPPMYYDTLENANYHSPSGNLYNPALIIGQTSTATGTLLRHSQQQQQQQLLLQDLVHNGRPMPPNGSQRVQMDSGFHIL